MINLVINLSLGMPKGWDNSAPIVFSETFRKSESTHSLKHLGVSRTSYPKNAVVLFLPVYIECFRAIKITTDNPSLAIGDALLDLGFEVIRAPDVSRRGMNLKLQEFGSRIEPGDVALLFYAGHGVEIDGQNFLLPTDIPSAEPGQETFVKGEAIGLNSILAMLNERKARLNIVILDACRSVGQSLN